MSEQDDKQVTTLQRTATDDPKAWKAYWSQRGQLWRTEPEIDVERQKYLAERRAIVPDVDQGLYRFKDVILSRADVEWLLVTHEIVQELANWSEGNHQRRYGLDLRGANLRQVDLSGLPCLRRPFTLSPRCLHLQYHVISRPWIFPQPQQPNKPAQPISNTSRG